MEMSQPVNHSSGPACSKNVWGQEKPENVGSCSAVTIPVSLHLSRKEQICPETSPSCFQRRVGHSAGGMLLPSQPCSERGMSRSTSLTDTLLTVIYFCCQIMVLFNFPSKGDYIVWCVMSMEFQKLLDTIINCRILYLLDEAGPRH